MSQKATASRSVTERNTVMAYLLYEDLLGAVEFLERAFGFAEAKSERVDGPDGKIGHTEVHFGNSTILMGHPGPDYQNPRRSGANHSFLYVYVDDVDAHHARALAEGADVSAEVEDTPYGDRRYRALDPEGFEWFFAETTS